MNTFDETSSNPREDLPFEPNPLSGLDRVEDDIFYRGTDWPQEYDDESN